MTVSGDNPIRRPEDDTLGRAKIAQTFARNVLELDSSEGLVVGVLGPWGSGKTSFVNIARAEFIAAGVSILDFNPWMFSGAQQLVDSFFIELSAQLKMRRELATIGAQLEEYGEAFTGLAWLPVVGPFVERGRVVTRLLGRLLNRRKEGVSERRRKLEEALSSRDGPIVIVLDDIDRLSTPEIRDVFKLVRLTASFPRIVYVLAFDRKRVEQALEEEGIPGRDYLEKILQVAVDLPSIPFEVLNRQVFDALSVVLAELESAKVETRSLDEEVWPDIFFELVRPLVRNMRDVRRFAAAVHGTLRAVGPEMALADVLGLEAVRIFLPDVFRQLHSAVDALTSTSEASEPAAQRFKRKIEDLIEAAGPHSSVARAMIIRLFPAGARHIGGSGYGHDWRRTWLKNRRAAHDDILRHYLERVAGEGLEAFREAERALSKLADRDALDAHLRALEPARVQDVIEAFEIWEDQFRPEHVVPTTTVLLNLVPSLPERERGFFEFRADWVVGRVTYRLLRSLKDPERVEAALREILPEVRFLYAKLDLIQTVGHRQDVGHKLVSEGAAENFERDWRAQVRSTPHDQLANEKQLLLVLLIAKRGVKAPEDPITIPDSPEVTLAILRSAHGFGASQELGKRAVKRWPKLDWDALVELFGDETTLKDRIEALKASRPEDASELLDLADRYLTGWRPSRRGDADEEEG